MTQFAKPKNGKYKGKTLPIVGYRNYFYSSVHDSKKSDDNFISLKTPLQLKTYLLRDVELVKEETKQNLIPKVDRKQEMFLTFDPNNSMDVETWSSYAGALDIVSEIVEDEDDEDIEIYIYKLIKVISKKVKKTVEIIESDPIE